MLGFVRKAFLSSRLNVVVLVVVMVEEEEGDEGRGWWDWGCESRWIDSITSEMGR